MPFQVGSAVKQVPNSSGNSNNSMASGLAMYNLVKALSSTSTKSGAPAGTTYNSGTNTMNAPGTDAFGTLVDGVNTGQTAGLQSGWNGASSGAGTGAGSGTVSSLLSALGSTGSSALSGAGSAIGGAGQWTWTQLMALLGL